MLHCLVKNIVHSQVLRERIKIGKQCMHDHIGFIGSIYGITPNLPSIVPQPTTLYQFYLDKAVYDQALPFLLNICIDLLLLNLSVKVTDQCIEGRRQYFDHTKNKQYTFSNQRQNHSGVNRFVTLKMPFLLILLSVHPFTMPSLLHHSSTTLNFIITSRSINLYN